MTTEITSPEQLSALCDKLADNKGQLPKHTISVTNWHLIALADAYTAYKCAESYIGNTTAYVAECRGEYYDAVKRADIPFDDGERIAWYAKQNYAELSTLARMDDASETEFEI